MNSYTPTVYQEFFNTEVTIADSHRHSGSAPIKATLKVEFQNLPFLYIWSTLLVIFIN